MGARTSARESALQMLFAMDSRQVSAELAIRQYFREFPGDPELDPDPEGRSYAEAIVRGFGDRAEEVDEHIRGASRNWRMERMSKVDRNLIRLGAWELLANPKVPRAVIIDEAVELAKRYGTAESSKFVNGVLDRIAEDCGRIDEPLPERAVKPVNTGDGTP